jgi:hypothetical protein
MSRLAERYWASLTDFRPEALDHLIEHGRRRDLPLWRRYLASLLDVEVIGQPRAAEAEDLDQRIVVGDAPTSTAHYTLDSTVHVGTTVAVRRNGWPLLAFAVAALVFAASVSASLLTSGSERYIGPGMPATHQEAGGFSWATPEGWRRDLKTGAEVHYTSPDGKQELAAKSARARGDLMETWETSEQNASQGSDYHKIRLEETEFRGYLAVVWEYTFTLDRVPWHARLLGFNVGDRSYQINTWYQPDIETQALKTYDAVKDSFTVL